MHHGQAARGSRRPLTLQGPPARQGASPAPPRLPESVAPPRDTRPGATNTLRGVSPAVCPAQRQHHTRAEKDRKTLYRTQGLQSPGTSPTVRRPRRTTAEGRQGSDRETQFMGCWNSGCGSKPSAFWAPEWPAVGPRCLRPAARRVWAGSPGSRGIGPRALGSKLRTFPAHRVEAWPKPTRRPGRPSAHHGGSEPQRTWRAGPGADTPLCGFPPRGARGPESATAFSGIRFTHVAPRLALQSQITQLHSGGELTQS